MKFKNAGIISEIWEWFQLYSYLEDRRQNVKLGTLIPMKLDTSQRTVLFPILSLMHIHDMDGLLDVILFHADDIRIEYEEN